MANIRKHILDNGLTVLLREIHSAPLISWWVLYRVGSRNEPTGKTGISHWVEHMLFKGTERYPAGELDRAIDRYGGIWNAQTSMDYTAFYETMPVEYIDLALDLEADRMVNAQFEHDEVESERSVVIAERQGLENSPMFWLSEEVTASAFRVHGYHHEIIGDMADLETITRDDLRHHYEQYYVPNNVIAVAVGAFNSDDMLKQIEHFYGHLKPHPNLKTFVRPEPQQTGERRVMVERPGSTQFIEMAYRVPAGHDDDWFPLAVMDSVLSGPSGLGGGMIDNKTSRLYEALVESELAASIDGSLSSTVDPYLYSIYGTVRDGETLENVEKVIDQELDRIRQNCISDAELLKAKKQARALFAYSTESVTGQAFWLAFSENFDSYEWFESYIEKLQAVTKQDVLDVAQKYLRKQNRTVGWFIPTGDADIEDE